MALQTVGMILWVAFQHFVALEALVGTTLALWIGFLAWRGPTQALPSTQTRPPAQISRGRFQRILRSDRMSGPLVFKRSDRA